MPHGDDNEVCALLQPSQFASNERNGSIITYIICARRKPAVQRSVYRQMNHIPTLNTHHTHWTYC